MSAWDFLTPTQFLAHRPCLPAKTGQAAQEVCSAAARIGRRLSSKTCSGNQTGLGARAPPCGIRTRPPRQLLAPASCHISARRAAEPARGLCILHVQHASAGCAAQHGAAFAASLPHICSPGAEADHPGPCAGQVFLVEEEPDGLQDGSESGPSLQSRASGTLTTRWPPS